MKPEKKKAPGRLEEANFFLKQYFRHSRDEIIKINIASMKTAGYGGLLVLLAFIIITPYIFDFWEASPEYWLMVPVFGVFGIFASIYEKRDHRSYYAVQAVCILFYISALACFANIGLSPAPNRYEVFVGCFFVMMPVVFIVRPWIMSAIMCCFTVSYALLAYQLKDPFIAGYDVFTALVGLVFGHIAMFIIFKLRINDFLSREKYKRLSRTDLLTGLLNKRSYEVSCQQSMRERLETETGALFVFDVDDFKIINDTFGHVSGDNVLEMIGAILKKVFRAGDLVGRIGGDEFSAYIKVAEPAEADAIIREKAEQVLSQVREGTRKAFKIEVTVSIGVCASKNSGVEYREMYLNADRALYAVKQTTHDGWKLYNYNTK